VSLKLKPEIESLFNVFKQDNKFDDSQALEYLLANVGYSLEREMKFWVDGTLEAEQESGKSEPTLGFTKVKIKYTPPKVKVRLIEEEAEEKSKEEESKE